MKIVKCPLCGNNCFAEDGSDDQGNPVINYVCQTKGCPNYEETVKQVPDTNPSDI